jgi:hypothetical protein
MRQKESTHRDVDLGSCHDGEERRPYSADVRDLVDRLQVCKVGVERGKKMALAPGHHLLPHERWFACWILERQRTHRTPDILRMEQNYGPEGITLWAAAMSTELPGGLMVLSGIAFMLASGGGGILPTLGYSLDGLGAILILLGLIRAFQGTRAGRAFRGSRPFLKPR